MLASYSQLADYTNPHKLLHAAHGFCHRQLQSAQHESYYDLLTICKLASHGHLPCPFSR